MVGKNLLGIAFIGSALVESCGGKQQTEKLGTNNGLVDRELNEIAYYGGGKTDDEGGTDDTAFNTMCSDNILWTEEDCEFWARNELGFQFFRVVNIQVKGCFRKNDVAYWSRGGNRNQISRARLSGQKQRIFCDSIFVPTEQPTGRPTTMMPTNDPTPYPTNKPTSKPTNWEADGWLGDGNKPSNAPSISPEPTVWEADGWQDGWSGDGNKPSNSPSTSSEPTTAEPTTAEPTTAEPTTAEPTTAEPTTSEPSTSEPTTSEPTTPQPTVWKSDGWSGDGAWNGDGDKVCMTRAECNYQRSKMGFNYYHIGNFAIKGCYYNGNVAFWGNGGSYDDNAEDPLPGDYVRIYCKNSGWDGDGHTGIWADDGHKDGDEWDDGWGDDGHTSKPTSSPTGSPTKEPTPEPSVWSDDGYKVDDTVWKDDAYDDDDEWYHDDQWKDDGNEWAGDGNGIGGGALHEPTIDDF